MKKILLISAITCSSAVADGGATIKELVSGKDVAETTLFTGQRYTGQRLDRLYSIDDVLEARRIGPGSGRDPLEVATALIVGRPYQKSVDLPRYKGLCPRTGTFSDQVKCYAMLINPGEARAVDASTQAAWEKAYARHYGAESAMQAYIIQTQQSGLRGTKGYLK